MDKENRDHILKWGQVEKMALAEDDLAAINRFAVEPLTADQVFVFRAALCDNEVDRDFEVFPSATLDQFKDLFVGRTVIRDHKWASGNQTARIYATEIETTAGRTTKNGEPYQRLIGKCYMLRTDSSKDMIAAVQGGILREMSVGVSVKKAECSICGADNRVVFCQHWPSRDYEGKTCYFKLLDARDAYEVSFVAVPAQREAGVTKDYGGVPPQDPAAGAVPPAPGTERETADAVLELTRPL